MVLRTLSQKLYLTFGILLLIVLGTSAAALYGLNVIFLQAEDAIHDIPMQTAFLEIQYTTSKGHLFYEEMAAGDRNRTLDDIYAPWDEGIEFCNLLLDGGTWKSARYERVADSLLREQIQTIKESLSTVMETGGDRSDNLQEGGVDSDVYLAFKEAYENVMNECEKAKALALARSQRSLTIMETTFSRSRTAVIGQHQSTASHHILESIRSIDQSAQQINRGIQTITTSVQDLNVLTERVVERISTFQIRTNGKLENVDT
jgi:hypothetical protein